MAHLASGFAGDSSTAFQDARDQGRINVGWMSVRIVSTLTSIVDKCVRAKQQRHSSYTDCIFEDYALALQ